MKALPLLIVAAIFTLTTSNLNAEEVSLITNGMSDYVIVRPAQSSESQIYAAEELQKYVKQISGVELKIQTDAKKLPPQAILLGDTKYTSKILGSKPDIRKLGADGFRLCVKPPYVLITGGKVRGTLYGVYELLEKYGGCRWYSSKFSIIPQKSTLTIPAVDDTQVPAFAMREPAYYDVFRNPDFAVKLRANGSGANLGAKLGGHIYYAKGWFVHTFCNFVPAGRYFKDHPEYFAMKDGIRRKGQELCLSNPDVLKIITQRVKEVLRKDPNAQLISVSQPDGAGPCQCPKCKALDDREGSPAASIINFVNKVGAAIEKEFPHVLVETLAYQYTRKPPKTIKPRHNVVPRLCSIECDFSQPLATGNSPENVEFRQYIKKWGEISSKLLIWDYVTCFHPYIMPFPNFNTLQSNLQLFRDHHVYGVFSLGNYNGPHGDFAELRAWILAKLMWNPDQNINKLYDDFFNGYYGAAAKQMREYFDALQKLSVPDKNKLNFTRGKMPPWLTKEFFEWGKTAFDKAEQLVADDPARLHNVRMDSIPVYYALIERWPEFKVKWRWENGEARAIGVPPAYKTLAAEILERMNEGSVLQPDEYPHWSAKFRYDMRNYSQPAKPVIIKSGDLKAGVVPAKGAMLSILKIGDSKNYILPQFGGIDFTLGPKQYEQRWGSISKMEGTNAFEFSIDRENTNSQSVICNYHMPNTYRIQRAVSASVSGITIDTILTSDKGRTRDFAPHLRLNLDLGGVDSLYYRDGNDDWTEAGVPADRTFMTTIIRGDKLKSREFIVACAKSKRGVKIILPEVDTIDRIWIFADSHNLAVKIIIAMKKQTSSPGKQLAFPLGVLPLNRIEDMPRPVKIIGHTPKIVEIDDDLLQVLTPGRGDYVSDARAADKHSVKITNYPSWSLRWKIKPELFTPKAKYKLEMLVRIDKSGNSGEAFTAGVHDLSKKDGGPRGNISVSSAHATEYYKWYTVATFVPKDNQIVWLSPGKFINPKTRKSAIKAVYVDKLKFSRIKQ